MRGPLSRPLNGRGTHRLLEPRDLRARPDKLMNKALSWSTRRAGGSIREMAEEAARRQRMSLGEWLNTVVADEAAAAGVPVRDVSMEDKQSAIITRLREMDAPPPAKRPADTVRADEASSGRLETRRVRADEAQADDRDGTNHERVRREAAKADRPRDGRRGGRGFDTDEDRAWLHDSLGGGRKRQRRFESRSRHEADADRFEPRRPGGGSGRSAEFEASVEDMLASIERRVARTQRQTDAALASVSELLETSESRHDAQRSAFLALANRLGDVEGHVTHDGEGLKPIKGALARLEARLDTLTRRAEPLQNETVAQELSAGNRVAKHLLAGGRPDPSVHAAEPATPEAIARLEAKLNSILDVVGPLGRGAPADLPAQKPLRAAIDEIARRQAALDGTPGHVLVRPRVPVRPPRDLDRNLPMPSPTDAPVLEGLGRDIQTLLAKVDDVRRDVAERANYGRQAEDQARSLQALRADMAGLATALGDLAPRRSMTAIEAAIAVLTERMEQLRESGDVGAKLEPLGRSLETLRQSLAENDPRPVIGALEREVRTVGTKLEGLGAGAVDPDAVARIGVQTAEIRDLLSAAAARPVTLDKIERDLAALTQRLEDGVRTPAAPAPATAATGATADELRTLLETAIRTPVLRTIEQRLETLAAKVDEVVSNGTNADPAALSRHMDAIHADLSARLTRDAPATGTAGGETLERMIGSLAAAIETARRPGADADVLGGLEQQIGRLAERLDRSEDEFAALTSLQKSVGALFTQLEDTRAASLDIAEQAARKAVRENPDAEVAAHVTREIADMRALQDAADRRTTATLTAVHETLEKMVERLATIEHAAPALGREPARSAAAPALPRGDERRRSLPPASADKVQPASPAAMAASAEDFLIEPGRGFPSRDDGMARTAPEPQADPDGGRADFIAAARRAARAAQRDAETVSAQLPRAPLAGGRSTPGAAVAQAKAFFSSRKKAVMLSLGALFVVAGTYALVRTIGREDAAPRTVGAILQPKTAGRVLARAETPVAPPARSASLSPTSLPTSPQQQATAETPSPAASTPPSMVAPPAQSMAGSEPVVSGSMARAGAPRGGVEMPRAIPSPKLRDLAEAGVPGAQFETANRYAEGRTLPRDLKLAAQWYEKAAAQNFAPAQYRLGSLYEKGLGVTRDVASAKGWYAKAAVAGNARAMHNLAVLTAEGADGKPDYAGAATWFRKAAEYGVRDSQYNLAILLARGLGVGQNLTQSYTWFAIAAAQGDDDAGKKRDDVAAKLGAGDLAGARAAAEAFKPRPLDSAANDAVPPPGGWDGPAPVASERTVRPKLSAL